MPKSYEEISNANVRSNGKTDVNSANDSNHLGGIPAEQYATKAWVKEYHGNKESTLIDYINRARCFNTNFCKRIYKFSNKRTRFF